MMRALVSLLLVGAVLLPAADYRGSGGNAAPPADGVTVAAAWTYDRSQEQMMVDIVPGVPVNGVLEESDARSRYDMRMFADDYRLTLTIGQTLRIEMRSTAVDASLYIYDLEGFALGDNDNSWNNGVLRPDVRLDYTLAPGEYLIQATTANAGERGAYTLSVEILGPAKPAAPLTLGQTVEAMLEPTDNRSIFSGGQYADYYDLSVATAQSVDFSAQSTAFFPLLALNDLNRGGNAPLATNDWVPGGDVSTMSANLEPGRYRIQVYAVEPGETGAYKLTVGGTAPAGPELTAAGVVSSASFLGGAVAPGEILSFFGTGIGPAELTTLRFDTNNKVATELGGTRILFDGQPAAMVFAVSTQASAIAPYSLAGKTSTTIQIEVFGQRSMPVTVPVAAAKPAIFSVNQSGTGPGAVLNQDFSVNSAANPAARGSVVQIFLTGGGVTSPPSTDGGLAPSAPPFAELAAEVTVAIGGRPAQVVYSGAAPGLVNGLVQVNAIVAEGAPTGDAVEIVVTVGDVASRPGVTIAVR